jgi:hypothetical protein
MQARQPGTADEHFQETIRDLTQDPGTHALTFPNFTATTPLPQAEEIKGVDAPRSIQMLQSSPVPILKLCKCSDDHEIARSVALSPCNPADCALQLQTVEQGCSLAWYLINTLSCPEFT